MGYSRDLDEYREDELLSELAQRAAYRAKGLCDYCHRHSDQPSCRFHDRHAKAMESTQREPYLTLPKRELDGSVTKVDPAGLWAEVYISCGPLVRAYGAKAQNLVRSQRVTVIEQRDPATEAVGYFL